MSLIPAHCPDSFFTVEHVSDLKRKDDRRRYVQFRINVPSDDCAKFVLQNFCTDRPIRNLPLVLSAFEKIEDTVKDVRAYWSLVDTLRPTLTVYCDNARRRGESLRQDLDTAVAILPDPVHIVRLATNALNDTLKEQWDEIRKRIWKDWFIRESGVGPALNHWVSEKRREAAEAFGLHEKLDAIYMEFSDYIDCHVTPSWPNEFLYEPDNDPEDVLHDLNRSQRSIALNRAVEAVHQKPSRFNGNPFNSKDFNDAMVDAL